MDNGSAIHCFSNDARHHHVAVAVTSKPYDEGLGHSFCYICSDALIVAFTASSKVHHSEKITTFRTIYGASASANIATSLFTALADLACLPIATATFESSTSFSSVPLQSVPCFSSGPLSVPLALLTGDSSRDPYREGSCLAPLTTTLPPTTSLGAAPTALPCSRRTVASRAAPPLPSSVALPRASPARCRPPPRDLLRRSFPGRRPPIPPHARPPSSACPRPLPCDLPLVAAPPPRDLSLVATPPPPTPPCARPPSFARPPHHSPIPSTFLWSLSPLPATSFAAPSLLAPLLTTFSATPFPAHPPSW